MASKIIVESRIREIANLLFIGTHRSEIVQVLTKKWSISVSAVDKLIRAAREPAKNLQKAEDEVRSKGSTKLLLAHESATLSRIRKRELLAMIAEGQMKIPDEHIYIKNGKIKTKKIYKIPNFLHVLTAIRHDNEMTGDLAASQLDVKTTDTMQIIVSSQAEKDIIDQIGETKIIQLPEDKNKKA